MIKKETFQTIKWRMQAFCLFLLIGILGTMEYESLPGYTGPQTPLWTIGVRASAVVGFYIGVVGLTLLFREKKEYRG